MTPRSDVMFAPKAPACFARFGQGEFFLRIAGSDAIKRECTFRTQSVSADNANHQYQSWREVLALIWVHERCENFLHQSIGSASDMRTKAR